MESINIEKIQELKDKAEAEIVKILTQLQVDTKCKIESLDLHTEATIIGPYIVSLEIKLVV